MDEAAIRRFVRWDYPKVVAAVAAVCGDRSQAEDAVQEALARAWDRGRRGLLIDSAPAWITTVAINVSRSAARSAARRRRTEERALEAPVVGPPSESLDVLRAVAGLPRRQREAVVVRYFLGYDVAGTAAVLGVSEGTVKTLVFRARATLAARLADPEDGGDPADRHAQEVHADATA
jgi:RNA polymerase sigma-70 factor (ECF subfamily)